MNFSFSTVKIISKKFRFIINIPPPSHRIFNMWHQECRAISCHSQLTSDFTLLWNRGASIPFQRDFPVDSVQIQVSREVFLDPWIVDGVDRAATSSVATGRVAVAI